MRADDKFLRQSAEFWANVKLISQKVGYTQRRKAKTKVENEDVDPFAKDVTEGEKIDGEVITEASESLIKIPTIDEIKVAYTKLHLDYSKIVDEDNLTEFGKLLLEYFEFRARFLNEVVKPKLMNKDKARELYTKLKKELKPKCPLPINKQKGKKRAPAYYTCIVNMLIEANSKEHSCDYDPKELTAFTNNNIPVYSLSRRVDGAFPQVINPVAIWEIKEYYYTTTFGSRVADGVYETLVDGQELLEARKSLGINVYHYLMIDDYYTWWTLGKSYLCRICDILHMGLLTEPFFGIEVVEQLPNVIKIWTDEIDKRKNRSLYH